MKLFAPLYDRVLKWSRHRYAERYLAVLSFAESSFFPIPVDVMLAPMCLAERKKAWRYATIATVFSVLGGLAGYAIGQGYPDEIVSPTVPGASLDELRGLYGDQLSEVAGDDIVGHSAALIYPFQRYQLNLWVDLSDPDTVIHVSAGEFCYEI